MLLFYRSIGNFQPFHISPSASWSTTKSSPDIQAQNVPEVLRHMLRLSGSVVLFLDFLGAFTDGRSHLWSSLPYIYIKTHEFIEDKTRNYLFKTQVITRTTATKKGLGKHFVT